MKRLMAVLIIVASVGCATTKYVPQPVNMPVYRPIEMAKPAKPTLDILSVDPCDWRAVAMALGHDVVALIAYSAQLENKIDANNEAAKEIEE